MLLLKHLGIPLLLTHPRRILNHIHPSRVFLPILSRYLDFLSRIFTLKPIQKGQVFRVNPEVEDTLDRLGLVSEDAWVDAVF